MWNTMKEFSTRFISHERISTLFCCLWIVKRGPTEIFTFSFVAEFLQNLFWLFSCLRMNPYQSLTRSKSSARESFVSLVTCHLPVVLFTFQFNIVHYKITKSWEKKTLQEGRIYEFKSIYSSSRGLRPKPQSNEESVKSQFPTENKVELR